MPESDTQAPPDCGRMYISTEIELSEHEWNLLLDALDDVGFSIAGQRTWPHRSETEVFLDGAKAGEEYEATFHDPTGATENMTCTIERIIVRQNVDRGKLTLDI